MTGNALVLSDEITIEFNKALNEFEAIMSTKTSFKLESVSINPKNDPPINIRILDMIIPIETKKNDTEM
jgi:hypothetical protein